MMTENKRKVLIKYGRMLKAEIVLTILKKAKIRKELLESCPIEDLCEYLDRLESVFGVVEKHKILI